jgi:type IV conjugative transfer system coupling protein TraD
MKRNLLNFTRGSQLLGHFGFMFAAGLKGPLLVTFIIAAWLSYWEVTSALSDHQMYLAWMHLYATGYAFMEFDPAKLIELKLASGGTVRIPLNVVRDFPPMREAMSALGAAIRRGIGLSALVLVPGFIAFWWFAERFGGKSKERKHERGAMLVTLDELEAEIDRHNHAEHARELKIALGWKWRLAGRSAVEDAGFYTPAHLAGVPWPWRLEQSHTMLIGTTGTGKTVALSQLLAEARTREKRAVVFDLTGAFIETFYDPERDIILNPLDARCPTWSVFHDCTSEGEFHAAAEALVPHDGGGSEQFWVLAARMLFVEMCLHLQRTGQATNQALATRLMTADLAEVHKLMRGTMADPLTAPEAARMAESIRAVFNANAKALKLLPASGPRFSVRDWTRGVSAPGSILFLSARYVDMSICSQLLTLWLDTAMNTLMTMERTPDLRLWFLIDELGALHRLPALEKGLQTARNFGGAIVTGVHAFAKLKEVYGENMAMTLSSLARSKLILATADRETATWCSDFIGHRQVRDMEEGYSYGYNNARDAVSLTPRRQIEPLLLPDQFMNLPRLSGYLKFPDGFPAAPVTLVPRRLPRMAEGFIARHADPAPGQPAPDDGASASGSLASPRSAPVEGAPAANDDGAGKPVVPRQLKLNLPSVSREPDDADRITQRRLSPGPAHELSGPPAESKAGTAFQAVGAAPPAATLPPAPLLTGRNQATDDAQPSPDEKGAMRGDKPGSTDLKPLAAAKPQERPSPRERAVRDLLEGGVESRSQDFYEPDL